MQQVRKRSFNLDAVQTGGEFDMLSTRILIWLM